MVCRKNSKQASGELTLWRLGKRERTSPTRDWRRNGLRPPGRRSWDSGEIPRFFSPSPMIHAILTASLQLQFSKSLLSTRSLPHHDLLPLSAESLLISSRADVVPSLQIFSTLSPASPLFLTVLKLC